MPPHHRDEMVLSYSRVRNALGFWGMLLPLLLIFGGIMQLVKGKADLMLYRNSGKAAPPKTE